VFWKLKTIALWMKGNRPSQPYMGFNVGVEGYSTLGRRFERLPRVAIKLARFVADGNNQIYIPMYPKYHGCSCQSTEKVSE
jgi:hypothetical protein